MIIRAVAAHLRRARADSAGPPAGGLAAVLLPALAIGCSPAASTAQEGPGTTLIGQVTADATGRPIPDVVVSIEGHRFASLTDSLGRYELRGLAAGPRILTARHIGFAAARLPITLPRTGRVTRNLRLATSALAMEEIVVTSDATGRAAGELGTASVIGRDAIEHVTATSLAGVLQLVPGVETVTPGLDAVEQISLRSAPTSGSLFSVPADAGVGRGSEDLAAFGTLIVLDGVPLSNNANLQTLGPTGVTSGLSFTTSAGGGVDLRRIPAATLERVEVIRGVPSVRYGDLTQGAIVVETRAAPVAPIIEAKLDERTIEGSAVGGRTFGSVDHAGSLTFDIARTRVQPGVSADQSTRAAAQLAHRLSLGRVSAGVEPRLVLDTRLDFYELEDDRPENPDIRPNRSHLSRDRGFRLSERARLNLGPMSRMTFTGSVSRIAQRSSSRAPKVSGIQSFTDAMAEGRNEGFYIGGPYVASVDLEGVPWLAYSRIEWVGEDWPLGPEHEFVAGAELRREWNDGAGFQFDTRFPPQVTFNGVNGYDRPRSFADVPALATSGFYVGDRFSAEVGGLPIQLQGGLRIDLLHEDGSWFGGLRDAVLQPRLNLEARPLDGLRLRGGWGHTAKTPPLSDLGPARQFFDVINVNFFANDPAERLAVLTTFIRDPANPDLGLSTGKKAEVGLEADVAGASLALVAFRDETVGASGFASEPSFILRDRFALSDSTAGNGVKPEILLPALSADTVPILVNRPANVFDQLNRGLELTASLPEIAPIETRFTVVASWIETKTGSDARFFGRRDRFTNFQLSTTQPRTPYWEGLTERGEQLLVIYRAIHHQADLGLVLSLTVQHNAHEDVDDIAATDTLSFAGFVTRTGDLVEVPEAQRGNPEFADLRVARSGRSIPFRAAAPDWMVHLQASKTLPLGGHLRFWAFNFLDRRGRFFDVDRLARRYPPVRFGLELSFPTRAFFGT